MRASKTVRPMFSLLLFLAVAVSGCAAPTEAPPAAGAKRAGPDFVELVNAPDATFAWEAVARTEAGGNIVRELRMTSQTWKGIPWKHRIQVVRPKDAAHPEFCILINTGGDGGPQDALMAQVLAAASGCTVATVFNVPNQPLFNGKNEDALIAHTWTEYVKTGDPTWVLNIPMTRSVLRAMDAVQAATRGDGGPAVTGFLVAGASKRGWTAWLAGAAGDKRVKAVAPIVFDMLNMPAQIPHQIETLGKPSEMIHDYSDSGLLTRLDTPEGQRLVRLVDPYVYRDRITMPKLIVLGTNDRYWSTDALSLYWPGLKGPKNVFYIPNAGHGLGDFDRLAATMSGFARAVAAGRKLPEIQWQSRQAKDASSLTVQTGIAPHAVRLWRAEADTRDFRDAKWASEPVSGRGEQYTIYLPAPSKAYAASFAEVEYRINGLPLYLSTGMAVQPAQP